MTKLFAITIFSLLIHSGYASETMKGAKKDLDVFKQEMSLELKNIETNLKSMSEKAKSNSSASYKEAVKEITQKRDQLRSDLYDLQADTKGEWKQSKGKISTALNGLNERIQKALKD